MSIRQKLVWDLLQWGPIEARISKIQKRIYKHSAAGNKGRVLFLQDLLINSLDAKLLAVRKVTTNKHKKTPGLYGKLYTTPKEKVQLVESLSVDGKAVPIRRVWIPKPGKPEKRTLGIPTIKDRAKQKLVLMALEPEWEARFEPNSYGFRPGRSTHDGIEAIFKMLRRQRKENQVLGKFILNADLKGCFDNINHDYLLKTLNCSPRISSQVKAWLDAGIFEGLVLDPPYSDLDPSLMGTPRGGIISPFLANVTLHGMENFLKEWILSQSWPMTSRHENYSINKEKSIGFVRYADDFVVIHKDKEIVEKAKTALQSWLANTSQLKFNETKTKVVYSANGFNFLGFSIINLVKNKTNKVKIYPSKKNQVKLVKAIGETCRKYRSISAFNLVKALRPKMLGWANYFRYSECQEVFSKMDSLIFAILRAWVFRRDRRHGRIYLKEKYLPSGQTYTFQQRKYANNWVLVGTQKDKKGIPSTIFLPKLAWVSSAKYVKVSGTHSIYDGDDVYWALRTTKYGGFNSREIKLLEMQNGICTLCKYKFLDNDVEIDHIIPKALGGKDTYSNWQLVHKHCHINKTKQDLVKIKA